MLGRACEHQWASPPIVVFLAFSDSGRLTREAIYATGGAR
jgi:hypothetical protein